MHTPTHQSSLPVLDAPALDAHNPPGPGADIQPGRPCSDERWELQRVKTAQATYRVVWNMLILLLMMTKPCIGGGFNVYHQSPAARVSCLVGFCLFLEVFSAWLTFWSQHRSLVPKYSPIHSFASILPSLPHSALGSWSVLDTTGLWGIAEVMSSLSFYSEHLVSRFVYRADPDARSLGDKKCNGETHRGLDYLLAPLFHCPVAVKPCGMISAKFLAFPWWWHESRDDIPEITGSSWKQCSCQDGSFCVILRVEISQVSIETQDYLLNKWMNKHILNE